MKPVEILRSFQGYNPGEIAGFAEERAQAMIDAGVAKAYEEPKVDASVSAKKKDQKPEA